VRRPTKKIKAVKFDVSNSRTAGGDLENSKKTVRKQSENSLTTV